MALRIQPCPMHQRSDSRKLVELLMVSNFVEVFLARQGHLNKIGVNFLEKVQLPHLASIYGAMLAGVGYVLMGAGIPLHIPGVLDNYAAGRSAERACRHGRARRAGPRCDSARRRQRRPQHGRAVRRRPVCQESQELEARKEQPDQGV